MEIVINNLKINYVEEKNDNSNKNIILLHGWGVSINYFKDIISNLKQKYNVYALDLPGFGKSEEPDSSYDVEKYCKIVLEFIKQKKLENVTLIGHSFGGRIIIKMAVLGYVPEKIVLIDSAGIRPKQSFKTKLKVLKYKCGKSVLKIFLSKQKYEEKIEKYRKKVGSDDYNNATPVMRDVFKNVVNEDLTKYLKNITSPTLIVWGDQDTSTPLSDAKIMNKEIQNSDLVIIHGAGHYSFQKDLNYFLLILNNFLKE